MDEPAIKGALFQAVIDDLNRLVDEGRVSRAELEHRLERSDLVLLDMKISAIHWYDIFAYDRMIRVLRDVEGGGRSEYWFQRGERAAERLIGMGIYQQMDYLGRTASKGLADREKRFKAFQTDMKLLLTLHASMLNFGEWRCVVDPDRADRYRVEISGIEGIPDSLFIAAAGLFTRLSRVNERPFSWRYERPAPDLALMRMTAPV
jgi:hypothetical protein